MKLRWPRWLVYTNHFVDSIIILNAILILLNTELWFSSRYHDEVRVLLNISTWIFIGEIVLRIGYFRYDFFRTRWNIFDLAIVLVSSLTLLPGIMSLRMLRMLRLVRLFRLFSINASLRLLTESLFLALPRVLWTGCLFVSLFCIYATIGIDAYGRSYPQFFGTVGDAFFSLFQVMTLENWANGIARQVMATEPYAWLYFVSFILQSTYILLNLVFGVIASATIETFEKQRAKAATAGSKDMAVELENLRRQLERVQALLEKEAEKAPEEEGLARVWARERSE